MASTYKRGEKWWCRLKDGDEWISRPTPYRGDAERAKAKRFAHAAQQAIDKRRGANADDDGPLTLRKYIAQWLKEREDRGVASVDEDRRRLEKYVLPSLGSMRVDEIRPKHVRDLVRTLRARGELAPRSIIHVFRTLHNVFEGAVVDEHVIANPIKVKRGELPKKVDADPEWRARATYTVREVERLISDPAIPVERRVQYALKALAGLRHGEMAALCWRHLDYTAEPLARINVAQAYCTRTRKVKSTKTEQTRAIPMHPTLAKILAAWKLEHWERIYGRKPLDDDFVVPTRTMKCVDGADAVHAQKADLAKLGLRIEAGEKRDRGGHDLRSWFQTRCIEDGADSLIVRSFTHAADKSVNGGYERFSWAAKCREASKLKCSILNGAVLPLATAFATAEKKAAARWTSVVTPKGLERANPSASVRESSANIRIDSEDVNPRESSRTTTVASPCYSVLAESLALAVINRERGRARRLAEQLLAMLAPMSRAG